MTTTHSQTATPYGHAVRRDRRCGFCGPTLYQAASATLGLDVRTFEPGRASGAYWYWNRYPAPAATPRIRLLLLLLQ